MAWTACLHLGLACVFSTGPFVAVGDVICQAAQDSKRSRLHSHCLRVSVAVVAEASAVAQRLASLVAPNSLHALLHALLHARMHKEVYRTSSKCSRLFSPCANISVIHGTSARKGCANRLLIEHTEKGPKKAENDWKMHHARKRFIHEAPARMGCAKAFNNPNKRGARTFRGRTVWQLGPSCHALQEAKFASINRVVKYGCV